MDAASPMRLTTRMTRSWGERSPEFAESRRLMSLDALVGPPSVGISGETPGALIAAAVAKIAAEFAVEDMVVLHLRHIEDAVERGCDLDGVEVVFELEGAGAK